MTCTRCSQECSVPILIRRSWGREFNGMLPPHKTSHLHCPLLPCRRLHSTGAALPWCALPGMPSAVPFDKSAFNHKGVLG